MRKKVGIALSGGGARGFAHVGALKVLIENEIPIDMIAGTSAGSIIGAAIAAGVTPHELEVLASKLRYSAVLAPTVSRYGLLSNARLGSFVRREFGVADFRDLKHPLSVTAFDLLKNEGLRISSGDVAKAVRASSAVPRLFTPVRIDGKLLVDGGAFAPLPALAAREMGADVVIGVDLTACGGKFRNPPRSSAGILIRSSLAILKTASTGQHKDADIVITPEIAEFSMFDLRPFREVIERGEEAARQKLEMIKSLLNVP
ncbi:MAG: patatin [Acidobacteria bacterium OLB17]|nr:MAG: patatin [Acidobacteria bacterium OLB17]MCZ2390855.1 patatin-like phospholipase family protein [Acidobacteriota bacterium]